jgi:translation initiation factor 1
MSVKKLNSFESLGGLIYSTNPSSLNKDDENVNSLPKDKQELQVCLEKKGRGGKTVIIIKGYEGSDQELNEIAKALKQHCGVGGTSKDGEIIIQGNVREKVWEKLIQLGFKKLKRVGG